MPGTIASAAASGSSINFQGANFPSKKVILDFSIALFIQLVVSSSHTAGLPNILIAFRTPETAMPRSHFDPPPPPQLCRNKTSPLCPVFPGVPQTLWAASRGKGLPQLSSLISPHYPPCHSSDHRPFPANRTRSPFSSLSYGWLLLSLQ